MAYKSSKGTAPGPGSEDYFGDEPESKGQERMGQDQDPEEKDPQDNEGETAILPKSILAGKDFKPGDEVMLKIVRMHDDSVEVEYAPEKGESDESETPEEAPPPQGGGDSEMASMMQ